MKKLIYDLFDKTDGESLKPCPFCGTEAILYTEDHRYGTTYDVYCETCGATITRLDEKEVIEAWNRRENGHGNL